ncbi:bifunctional PIG-L family deacetylase/class I SAM-dependent methyltransferase [Nocardioides sp. KIGAM211]|uniref:Bifunctional PIG-L family deacetylase/class I SAM-dependent methyltransferase n=1 Tax=Nocardioides luti TaxID=2761101 RepID=A0A7X0REE9_9ACTN|nr:bifunctional PIG-L family deacetylase/class I SAM-dependent methyltransferase [Nocardioides luti]
MSHDPVSSSWRADPRWRGAPRLDLADAADGCTRLVVVAAHPADAAVGAGGLIARAHEQGMAVYVVQLTAGPPDQHRLGAARAALAELVPDAPLVFLGAEDGRVEAVEGTVTTALVETIGDGRGTLLLAPWPGDGHPDHEAAGRAATVAARRTGARLLHYPVHLWRTRSPEDAPWPQLRGLELAPDELDRKRRAVAAHDARVHPLPDEPLEHLLAAVPAVDDELDVLHREREDPWGVEERWYEHRKRDLTLAVLPRRRFRRALEVGCSRGALAEALATRASATVAVDRSPMAVHLAQQRLGGDPSVTVAEYDVPTAWPAGEFDLVVLSEVGYFLSPADLDLLIERIAGALTDDGVVLLCHWRHPIHGWVLDGPDVHERFRASTLPAEAARYRDRDVEIVVLCHDRNWPDPAH